MLLLQRPRFLRKANMLHLKEVHRDIRFAKIGLSMEGLWPPEIFEGRNSYPGSPCRPHDTGRGSRPGSHQPAIAGYGHREDNSPSSVARQVR